MRNGFTTKPQAESMVTEPCIKDNCIDLLCVECNWEGHCEPADAPWVIFQTHTCKMRTESTGSGW